MAPKRNTVTKKQTKIKKSKRKMFKYSQDDLRRALIEIQENGMGIKLVGNLSYPKPPYKID